ncbi:monovalent cation/H(+) antiporter subunit G, partial [Rhizobium ruizarguesonis]
MIDYIVAAITALLMIVGALFALAAAIGLVRLPDLYTRM